MAVAVLMVHMEDGVVTLPKWWRKAAAVTLAGLVLATVLLADSGTILTLKGAVPYETLTTICAGLLLTLVILPSAGSFVSFRTPVLETRVLAAVGLASYNMFQWHEPSSGGCRSAASRSPVGSVFVMDMKLLGAVDGGARSAEVSVVECPALARKSH